MCSDFLYCCRKDHVHHEEVASKSWPNQWGFLTTKYEDVSNKIAVINHKWFKWYHIRVICASKDLMRCTRNINQMQGKPFCLKDLWTFFRWKDRRVFLSLNCNMTGFFYLSWPNGSVLALCGMNRRGGVTWLYNEVFDSWSEMSEVLSHRLAYPIGRCQNQSTRPVSYMIGLGLCFYEHINIYI